MAYTKPVRPALIIAMDQVEKFANQKPDPAVKEKRKKMVSIFRKNNDKK